MIIWDWWNAQGAAQPFTPAGLPGTPAGISAPATADIAGLAAQVGRYIAHSETVPEEQSGKDKPLYFRLNERVVECGLGEFPECVAALLTGMAIHVPSAQVWASH